MQTGDEVIVLKIERKAFEELYNNALINFQSGEYELKEVNIHNEAYPEDKNWVKLKEESNKSFKALKEYEFKLRHEKL